MPSLIVLVLHDLSNFDKVLDAWHRAGAPAVTIFDCVGTRDLEERIGREDLPLFPSVRDVFQAPDVPRKTVFSVVQDDRVDPIIDATLQVVSELKEGKKGILFVVPVSRVVG